MSIFHRWHLVGQFVAEGLLLEQLGSFDWIEDCGLVEIVCGTVNHTSQIADLGYEILSIIVYAPTEVPCEACKVGPHLGTAG
jgi:hypothetical protein